MLLDDWLVSLTSFLVSFFAIFDFSVKLIDLFTSALFSFNISLEAAWLLDLFNDFF
jgi:hypothetical protein